MKKLELRFTLFLLLEVAFVAFAYSGLNVKADSNTPGNSGENTFNDDLADYPHVIDHHIPGINDGNDDDNDDGDIGDEGFYDDDNDDDDDDGSQSLRQGLVRGSNSSVVHKKDEVRSSGVKNTSPQKQQSADDSEINESGSSDDIDDKSGRSGSGNDEGKDHGVFASQHVSEEEGSSDEEASSKSDETENSGNEEHEWNNDHTAVRSNLLHKRPRNMIKKVIEDSKNSEKEGNNSSGDQDTNEENAEQNSGFLTSYAPENDTVGVGVGDEHPILKPHPKNVSVSYNHTITKEKEKGEVILPTQSDGGVTGNRTDVIDRQDENKKSNNSVKSTQLKDTLSHDVHKEERESKVEKSLKAEHKGSVQNTQPHHKPVKKEPIRTDKVSPHLARKKLHNKYLASHVTHPHMSESHRKVAHTKTIRKAAPSTCQSDKILVGHSLKGGTRAGRFEVLGDTASMHACLQRCCSKKTCDVALLIDGRCYGVDCYSDDLCKAIPVPHPHFIFSQLGFINKGQKRGDIERKQEFHCQYGNLTLRNNEEWSGELCGGVVRCKNGIVTVKKCSGIPPKPDDCTKPRLVVKHQKGKCCQMKWKCKARHCIFNNRLIKHGYTLSDPLCTGIVSCYNGHLNMEHCPKIPDKPKDCARPKLKTINIPGKCCKKLWVCSDKSCTYDGLKLSHGEKLTDGSCAIVMECRNGFLRNKQCPGPPPVPRTCINPTLKVKRIPGECCEMNWKCEIS